MKKIILSFILLAFIINVSPLLSQCYNVNDKVLNSISFAKSTNIAALDKYLNAEQANLQEVFKVDVDLFIMDDTGAPNAFATPENKNPRFDGSVYLGVSLLADELYKRENGQEAVSGIMAHEFAHVLQAKLDCKLEGSFRELHADFLAGYYMGKVSRLSKDAFIAFGASLYEKGDTELWNEDHHGTPKKRLALMTEGFVASSTISSPKEAYKKGLEFFDDAGTLVANEEPKREILKSVTLTLNDGKDYQSIFSVKFEVHSVEYQGLIALDNVGKGKMRFRFSDNNADKIIEQDVIKIIEGKNVYLLGSNPINVRTGRRYLEYSADSFGLITKENGELLIKTIDEKGTTALADMLLVTDTKNASDWLKFLNWY